MASKILREWSTLILTGVISICTGCEIDTEVAVPNIDDSLINDTGSNPEYGLNGPRASVCEVVGYEDVIERCNITDSYHPFTDGHFTVTTSGQKCQLISIAADGELECNLTTPFLGPKVIVTDDGKTIGMYEEELSEDLSLVVAKIDGDVMEWSIDLPGKFGLQHSLDALAMNLAGGDLLIAFAFTGSVTLGRGEGNETTLGDPESADVSMFLARYDVDNGELLSATALLGDDAFVPDEVTVGPAGRIYTAGRSPLNNGENECIATALFDEAGDLVWVNHIPCDYSISDMNIVRDIEALPLERGDFYLQGEFFTRAYLSDRFENQAVLEAPVIHGEGYVTSAPTHFIARFNSNGALMWAKNDVVSSEDENHTYAYAAALFGDKLLVGGSVDGVVKLDRWKPGEVTIGLYAPDLPEFDPTEPNWEYSPPMYPYIALYDSDGDLEWAKVFAQRFTLGDVAVTADNEVRVVGTFDSPVEFDINGETVTLNPGNDPDLGVGFFVADLCSE